MLFFFSCLNPLSGKALILTFGWGANSPGQVILSQSSIKQGINSDNLTNSEIGDVIDESQSSIKQGINSDILCSLLRGNSFFCLNPLSSKALILTPLIKGCNGKQRESQSSIRQGINSDFLAQVEKIRTEKESLNPLSGKALILTFKMAVYLIISDHESQSSIRQGINSD